MFKQIKASKDVNTTLDEFAKAIDEYDAMVDKVGGMKFEGPASDVDRVLSGVEFLTRSLNEALEEFMTNYYSSNVM